MFCCGSLLSIFGVRALFTFHLIFVHYTFSFIAVQVAEGPFCWQFVRKCIILVIFCFSFENKLRLSIAPVSVHCILLNECLFSYFHIKVKVVCYHLILILTSYIIPGLFISLIAAWHVFVN